MLASGEGNGRLRILGLLTWLGLAACACAEPLPPYLVLITLDTTRADRLGVYGHAGAETPHLDAFAAEAVVYDKAWSTSSWTLPAHASLFTGLMPMQHGARALARADGGPSSEIRALGPEFETLTERLSGAGYRTGAVLGGPALRREFGIAQGFEVYRDAMPPEAQTSGVRAEQVADLAIETLTGFAGQPFFLFVNFFDPHGPYAPPGHNIALADAAAERVLALMQRAVASRAAPRARAQLDPEARHLLEVMLAGYDAEIRYMDRHLGRLLDALPSERPGLVVITADHGESFGEHHLLYHGAHLYDDAVRVPLLIRWPDRRGAGTRVARPVQIHQLFATLLEAAGLPLPAHAAGGGVDGEARPLLLELHPHIRLFGSYVDRNLRAIVDFPYKLIETSDGDVELYDLEADPGELRDLSPLRVEEVRGLRSALARTVEAHPPRYRAEARAELSPETHEALRELGYVE